MRSASIYSVAPSSAILYFQTLTFSDNLLLGARTGPHPNIIRPQILTQEDYSLTVVDSRYSLDNI